MQASKRRLVSTIQRLTALSTTRRGCSTILSSPNSSGLLVESTIVGTQNHLNGFTKNAKLKGARYIFSQDSSFIPLTDVLKQGLFWLAYHCSLSAYTMSRAGTSTSSQNPVHMVIIAHILPFYNKGVCHDANIYKKIGKNGKKVKKNRIQNTEVRSQK